MRHFTLTVLLPLLMVCRGSAGGGKDHLIRPSGYGTTFNQGWEFTRVDEMEDAVAGRKEIPKKEWKLIPGSSEAPLPHEMKIDLGRPYDIGALTYLPRQDGNENGMIKNFELYVSEDTLRWGAPVIDGEFKNSRRMQVVNFFKPRSGRFIRLVVKSNYSGNQFASIAEIGLLKKSPRVLGKNWTDQFLTEFVASSADTASPDHSLLEELKKLTKNTWRKVTLPHTAVIEPLIIANPWEGIAYYRKTFKLDKSLRGKHVTVEFGGAMQLTDVLVQWKICISTGGWISSVHDRYQWIGEIRSRQLILPES